jgi:hypothetical protein
MPKQDAKRFLQISRRFVSQVISFLGRPVSQSEKTPESEMRAENRLKAAGSHIQRPRLEVDNGRQLFGIGGMSVR